MESAPPAKRLRIGDTSLRRMGDSALRLLLPEEVIIEEILSRLPVKPLLRFKCVSKSWYCLISSKHFIKTHLGKSKIRRLMLNLDRKFLSPVRLFHYPLPSSSSSDLCGVQVVDYIYGLFPQAEPSKLELRFVGCCHGIFCFIIDEKYFVLFNPSTRESKKLPLFLPYEYYGRIGTTALITRYGFAFNDSLDDYQVFTDVLLVEKTLAYVYSLNGDCWYNIACVEHSAAVSEIMKERIPYSVGAWGKYVNGKLHWQVRLEKGQPLLIKAVDVNTRASQAVDRPPCDDDKHGFESTLSILDGCLCELRIYEDKNQLDVWVYNDYGVKDSWTKRFTIFASQLPLLWPVCTLPSGEVLFLNINNCVLVSYNPKENKLVPRPKENKLVGQGQNARYRRFCGAFLYEESLVSLVPDPDGEQERQVSLVHDPPGV